jgi:hypothetical protein
MLGNEDLWYEKPFRKQTLSPSKDLSRSHSIYIEWPLRPLRPVSEREVGYFGDDVFDYDDSLAEDTWHLMEKDADRRKKSLKNEDTQKDPDDLEDFQFTTLQDVFGPER